MYDEEVLFESSTGGVCTIACALGATAIVAAIASFAVGVIGVEPGEKFRGGIGERVCGQNNTEGGNEHEGHHFDSVDAADSRVESNGILGSLCNSAINLRPDIAGENQ